MLINKVMLSSSRPLNLETPPLALPEWSESRGRFEDGVISSICLSIVRGISDNVSGSLRNFATRGEA